MTGRWILAGLLALAWVLCLGGAKVRCSAAEAARPVDEGGVMMPKMPLPQPSLEGTLSVEEAIQKRRSRRSFADRPLDTAQLGQLLWSAQGVTDARTGKRAAPSAGATYPMELFVAVGARTVGELEAGLYRYVPAEHALQMTAAGDVRDHMAAAALGQGFVAAAPLVILMAADYDRTAQRYGERAPRYVHMEAGHISQNLYLQAEALGLATVAVGAFRDEAMARAARLPDGLAPLYLMPFGYEG